MTSRFGGLVQDVRYAARLLRRQPRHTLLTILTMALGIGATTVLFSVTCGVLMMRLLSTQLYGITADDTLTFVLVPLVLCLCGALACLLAARRAGWLDPLRVLRRS